MESWLALLAAVGLAFVHLLADRIHRLRSAARGRLLSFVGGTSVAFVFAHLLPELQEAHALVAREAGVLLGFLEHHVYLAALLGVVVYYGAEHAALRRTRRDRPRAVDERAGDHFFRTHIALFAFFNAVIGYLLAREDHQPWPGLVLLWIALALHFFANDFALREHHREAYHRSGRWVLAASVLLGAALGTLLPVDEAVVAILLAFAAGGIVLNALKEELPAERESRFGAFAFGAAVYTGLIVLV